MQQGFINMTHLSDPEGVYTAVPERSFRDHWQPKGWVSEYELDPKPQPTTDEEPNGG